MLKNLAEYLISRGQTIQLDSLERPKQSWISIEDIMATSFLMESDLTTSLQQLYAMAERNSDIRTTVFLDPMIEKQNQAEHDFALHFTRTCSLRRKSPFCSTHHR